MTTIAAITRFLERKKWLLLDDPEEQITFLAAGEYNENYRIEVQELYGESAHVFRINHGSQLGLKDQIAYEFAVLRALSRSGVTPRPFYCDTDPGDEALGRGVLLMEYLPGEPLDYERDLDGAAQVFARVHAQPVDDRLIKQADPVVDIARESLGLINRYPAHKRTEVRDRLLAYHEEIIKLGETTRSLFEADPLVIVNTEVNSRNFLVDEDDDGDREVRLVDWEKAVVSSRFQDLGHFMVPTTTLWKSDFRFTDEGREQFVAAYLDAVGLDMDLETAMQCASVMERTILLRAMSWCYMAYHEYTTSDRALKNTDTFEKISFYLDEIGCFLEQNK